MNGAQKSVLIWGGIALAISAAAAWAISRFTNFNKGTPYEGTGAVGTLGNVADKLSGGALSSVGSKIGTTLYDWTHDDGDAKMFTYSFTFVATGAKGAVNSEDIDSRGVFTYFRDGKKYQLKTDAQGNRFATAI